MAGTLRAWTIRGRRRRARRRRDFFSRKVECGVWSENTPSGDSAARHSSLHTPHSTLHENILLSTFF
jgi:hypothetical protein